MNSEQGAEKKLVLLVDGNPAVLRLGRSALEGKYDVATVPSIEKMLKLLENNSPDVILMNESMRGASSSLSTDFQVIYTTEPFDSSQLNALVGNHFKGVKK